MSRGATSFAATTVPPLTGRWPTMSSRYRSGSTAPTATPCAIQVFKAIKDAKDKRFMTDALPHMMVWLAGIAAKDYRPAYNLLSPDYNPMRPRILKNSADYDLLRARHEAARRDRK